MGVFKEVEDKSSIFKNLYDNIRIVDPVNKKVLLNINKEKQGEKHNCYSLWNRNINCKNCISMRAYLEDDTFVKLEYGSEKVFMVIASPIVIEENRYMVEIIKDISKNGYIRNKKIEDSEVELLIGEINEKIIKDELTGISK